MNNNKSNDHTMYNITVFILSIFTALVLSTILPDINSNSDSSSSIIHRATQTTIAGKSLSHLVYPHPMNLTWHLKGPVPSEENKQNLDEDYNDHTRSSSIQDDDNNNDSNDTDNNNHHNNNQGSPLVTIHDILSHEIVSKIVKELKSSTQIISHPNGQKYHQCILKRDELPCSNERWIDFNVKGLLLEEESGKTTDDVRTSYIHNFEPAKPRDIFEQAVIEIAKKDVTKILKPHIAKHVMGVSWRVLVTKSGQINSIFHYDTDEDTEYVIPSIPLIYPLLSTVTYLTDAGEPTLILEHAQLISPLTTTSTSTTSDNSEEDTLFKILYPQNAYISMPKTNKHLAFDSRLFHGSAMPLSKKKGEYRIVIGMNFHTHQSIESKNEHSNGLFHWDKVIPPIKLQRDNNEAPIDSSSSYQSDKRKHDEINESVPSIQPWDVKSIIDRPSHYGWEQFDLFRTESHGYDFCLRPCFVKVQLPMTQILKYDEKYPGATLGFRLQKDDFYISATDNENDIGYPPPPSQYKVGNWIEEAKSVASDMLKKRCEIYNNNIYEMSPPLNQC